MAISKKVKHLIFDFGGVFLDLGGKYTGVPAILAKIFNISEKKAAEIWKKNKEKLLIGKETPKEFLIRVNNDLKSFIDIDESYEIWKKLGRVKKGRINWDLVDYVKSLRKKYKIYIFTNTVDLDNRASKWFGSIAKHFDNIYKSFEMGYKKPNKEAFLHVLGKINAKPEECIFIDDFQENIDATNEIGIKGVLYTTLGQLKKDFANLGIII